MYTSWSVLVWVQTSQDAVIVQKHPRAPGPEQFREACTYVHCSLDSMQLGRRDNDNVENENGVDNVDSDNDNACSALEQAP
mmetsp:Transcript_44160/g.70626  ORF Transcript_44160/g.70626 Transcript_44160/m.70626 type:complete len:81 (+) Transcript_44160:2556-2798(+)